MLAVLLCLLFELCALFYWLGYTFTTPALCGFACACACACTCTCTYARCQSYGTDINHSAQQAHSHTYTLSTHTQTHTHTTPHTSLCDCFVTQLYESRRLVSMPCFKRSLPALHTFCSSHWGLKFPYEHEHVLNKKGHYAMKKHTKQSNTC